MRLDRGFEMEPLEETMLEEPTLEEPAREEPTLSSPVRQLLSALYAYGAKRVFSALHSLKKYILHSFKKHLDLGLCCAWSGKKRKKVSIHRVYQSV